MARLGRYLPRKDLQVAAKSATTAAANAAAWAASSGRTSDTATAAAFAGNAAAATSATVYAVNHEAVAAIAANAVSDWDAFADDLAMLLEGYDLDTAPLWPLEAPEQFTQADRAIRAKRAKDPETWNYWVRWWHGVLAGKPLDLGVQKAIAREIPDADWSDPKAVAAHIRRLEEREALRREVAELRTQLAASQDALVANPAHRGHNNPPELIDLPAEVREAGAEIAAQLEGVSEELAKPRQSSMVLRKAGAALVAGAKTILLYCGRKADAVLDHALKPLGLALGTQAAAWLSGVTWEQVMAFGESLIEFAAKWPWP